MDIKPSALILRIQFDGNQKANRISGTASTRLRMTKMESRRLCAVLRCAVIGEEPARRNLGWPIVQRHALHITFGFPLLSMDLSLILRIQFDGNQKANRISGTASTRLRMTKMESWMANCTETCLAHNLRLSIFVIRNLVEAVPDIRFAF
jgi:hypothetical protein